MNDYNDDLIEKIYELTMCNSLVTFHQDFSYDKQNNFKNAQEFTFDNSLLQFSYKDMIDCYALKDTVHKMDQGENDLSFDQFETSWQPEGDLKTRFDLAYVEINKLRTGLYNVITALGEKPSEFISIRHSVYFDMNNKLYQNEIKVDLCYRNKCINSSFMIYVSDFNNYLRITINCGQHCKSINVQKINPFSLSFMIFDEKEDLFNLEDIYDIDQVVDLFKVNHMSIY